jgi:CDGSH-type Zn-finger protein
MTQPFCDGSHEGTGLEPMSFAIREKTTVWLCNCKHSKDRPHCDGTHHDLSDDIF